MSIRVIAGEFGGRKLEAVPGFGTRPLLGQVREALFNILGEHVEDALVWDLFAGTGASGIEALSRGARRVVFVEKSARPLRILKQNLESVDPDGELDCAIVRGNAWKPSFGSQGEGTEAAEGESAEGDDGGDDDEKAFDEAPDLVFFDPPYPDVRADPTRAVARLFSIYERCAPGARIVFHFPDGVLDADDFASFDELDLRSWGQAAVAILRRDKS